MLNEENKVSIEKSLDANQLLRQQCLEEAVKYHACNSQPNDNVLETARKFYIWIVQGKS